MKARTILIGCAVVVVLFGGLVIIGGILAFKRITSPIPLQEPSALLDANSAGIAVMRLEPNDPLVEDLVKAFPDLNRSLSEVSELLPMHFVWTAHRSLEDAEGHTIRMSIEPRGRLIGMLLDFALWQASGDDNVAREEYNDEGITSFPTTPIPGFVFVRGNTFVWSSDVETAHMAVDGVSPDAPERPDLSRLLPEPGKHTFYGVIGNDNGSLVRSLAAFPGEALDFTPGEAVGLDAVTFTLDSGGEAALDGDIHLHFDPDTDASTQRRVSDRFAERLSALSRGELIVKAGEPAYENDTVTFGVSVTGLSELKEIFNEISGKAMELLESLDQSVIQIDP